LAWKRVNNHENIEHQKDNPYDYFLQLTSWSPSYKVYLSNNTAGNNTMPTCIWQGYDSQYFLQGKLGSNKKIKKLRYQ
jgi:hypothetical protein